ncbi:disease resistance protein RUN1 [Trifolium repens]|nr:disease resistance protein RUN1 [Trifolium repens]
MVFTGEVRLAGERVGFEVVTLDGRTCPLASSNFSSQESHRWPNVGKYKVDVASFESLALPELQVREDTDLFIIDKVGKMELYSSSFFPAVLKVLDSNIPILASIPVPKFGRDIPAVARLRNHAGATLFTLSVSNRDAVREQIHSFLEDLFRWALNFISSSSQWARYFSSFPMILLKKQRAEVWLLSEMEIGYYRRMGILIIIIREWIQIIVIIREWGDCCVGLGFRVVSLHFYCCCVGLTRDICGRQRAEVWLECVVHSLFKSSILAVLVLPQSVWLKRIVSVSLLFPRTIIDFQVPSKSSKSLGGALSELQHSHDAAIIFDALYATNSKEMEPTTTTSQVSNMVTSSQVSKHSSKSPLIQIGMNGQVINILKEIILQV